MGDMMRTGEGPAMRLGMSMMRVIWGMTRMEGLLEWMSGERAGAWSFGYYCSLSLFLFWSLQSHSPLWLSSTANEQTKVLMVAYMSQMPTFLKLKFHFYKNLQFLQHSPNIHHVPTARVSDANEWRMLLE